MEFERQQMVKEFSAVLHFLNSNKDAIVVLLAIAGFAPKIFTFARSKYYRYLDLKNFKARVGAGLYTKDELLRATECYVEPDCQSLDPSGGEDFRKTYAVRQKAFESLDLLINSSTEHKHSILLGDSGMGKTSLLLNYYARHYRKRNKTINIYLVPLGYKNADSVIRDAADRSNTVLFLDAFDEDTKAIDNHRERLGEILRLADGFAHVLISCRTQFFEKDVRNTARNRNYTLWRNETWTVTGILFL
jgi:hypothetical protein